jgi:hypothetical protein
MSGDDHVIEVRVTVVEGTVSARRRRRLLEANLALLESLVEQLRVRLGSCADAEPESALPVAGGS